MLRRLNNMQSQPLAINPKVFEYSFLNYDENIFSIVSLVEKIEKFHKIYKDSNGKWILQLEEIKNKLEFNQKNLFDLLITNKLAKYYYDVEISELDLLKAITKRTPDLLLISEDNIADINCYTQDDFISDEYKPNNILFRIPKPVTVVPNYSFRNFDFIAPYVRNASKIEIIDKQLFKDARNEFETNFLLDLLKRATQLKEIQLYWEPNDANLRHFDFKQKFLKIFPKAKIHPSKQYLSRGKNHDRFIIVNNTEFSIRFTCSFNNFYFKNDSYIAKAGFIINYEKGRSFYE